MKQNIQYSILQYLHFNQSLWVPSTRTVLGCQTLYPRLGMGFTWVFPTGFWDGRPSTHGYPWESDMGRGYFFMIVKIIVFGYNLGKIFFLQKHFYLKSVALILCHQTKSRNYLMEEFQSI